MTATSVPLFHPQLQRWREHFTWSDDGTEIIGLSPIGRATVAALHMNRPAMIRVGRMWVAMAEHPPQDFISPPPNQIELSAFDCLDRFVE
jgi:hypothetical protein